MNGTSGFENLMAKIGNAATKSSHMLQLKILHAATKKKKKIPHTATKTPCATSKTQCSQINNFLKTKTSKAPQEKPEFF